MSVRLAHISDTHLGFADLDRLSPAGINQREADIYAAWHNAVALIVEHKPDAVVHTGDFFHRPCPTNRALIEGFTGLKRLNEAGIPVIIIAGNHSTPKTVYTSPILKSLESFDLVYPIFREQYESVTVAGCSFHGLPHINDDKKNASELEKMKPHKGRLNILLLHTALGADFLMEEFGERIFPNEKRELLSRFEYVALGHFHRAAQVKGVANAWYSGSTERFSDRETSQTKGFLMVELSAGGEPKTQFIPLPVRPWYRIEIKNCSGKSVADIKADIKKQTQELALKDAIISIYFESIKPAQSIELSNAYCGSLFPETLAVLPRRIFVAEHASLANADIKQQSLFSLFDGFLKEQAEDEREHASLSALGSRFFRLYEESEKPNAGGES